MIVEGTQKVAIGWSARGHLLIGQGNKVIEINEFQAVQLMAFIADKKSAVNPTAGLLTFVAGDEPNQRGA